jgi:hypothetical protein
MNDLLAFAERMLSDHGEFHPFGGYMLDDGSITQIGVDMGDDSNHSGEQRAVAIESTLRSICSSLHPLVVGLVANVALRAESGISQDAVQVALEHRDGYSAEVFFAYELQRIASRKKLSFTATTAQRGQPKRFFR